jgi:Holliday junction DNA helicase RuvA
VATVWAYLHVTDREHRLYGFASEQERSLFCQLVESVSQVGPKKALAILSSTEVQELAEAIEREDVDRLKRIKGIGEKMAQRLLLELKGRVSVSSSASPDGVGASLKRDVLNALVSLGYDRKPAEATVEKALHSLGRSASSVEELLRACLRSP